MKLFITGIAGFLGTNIALLAKERGYDVEGVDNFSRFGVEENALILKDKGVQIFHGDVRDPLKIDADVIIHLAAQVGVRESIEKPVFDFSVNVKGTLNVLEAAIERNIPVIYASTNKVFTQVNSLSLTEEDTRYSFMYQKTGIDEYASMRGKHTPYGLSKLTAASYCLEYFYTYNLPTVVNHMSCLYGYYQQGIEDQGWVNYLMKCVLSGKATIYGDGKQVRDLLWCKDIAELYLLQAENIDRVKGEEFVIGGGQQNTMSVIEAIRYLEKLSGKTVDITYKDWRSADQKVFYADLAKIQKYLPWKPTVSPEEGIRLMYEKYTKV